jgi:DNA-binding NtrC family response regulator
MEHRAPLRNVRKPAAAAHPDEDASMPTAGGRHGTTQPDAQVTARPRVLISEPRGLDSPPIAELLDPAAYDVVWCNGEQDVLEQLVQRRPSALVFALGPGHPSEITLLHLLRRIAPALPMILVATTPSLETQKMTQELRPIYYVVRPVDRAEIHEAIAAAIAPRGHRPPG